MREEIGLTHQEHRLLPEGHEMLRRAMPKVPVRTGISSEIASILLDAMRREAGIGLSANQIGMEVRAFSMEMRNGEEIVLFNPEIVERSLGEEIGEEGCLSFPGLRLKVRRHERVTVRFQDVMGDEHDVAFEGIDAICAQHEIDHLDGVTFTDRVSRLALKMAYASREKRRRS